MQGNGQAGREELERVLSSACFARSERVSKLLRFLVERQLDGRENELKESVIGVEVYGRFSLDDPRSSLISTDWVVGIHTVADLGAWQIDLHTYHESSHLGDEYAETFHATRLDWTREVATLGARYQHGRLGIAGYASYTLVDALPLAKPAAAFAVDYRTPSRRLLGTRAHLIAAVYGEAQAYAGWKLSSSARLGGAFQGGKSGREMGLSAIYFDGISTQRQFYRAKSRYVGVELRFGL